MKVLKFGGTSVGTVESLTNVKTIVESIDEPVVVVVSALGGLTDKLIATARAASEGDKNYIKEYQAIIDRHHNIINGVVREELRAEVLAEVDPLLKELGDVFLGISLLQDLSERTLDRVVSFGERMSSVIVSRAIEGGVHMDSADFIRTIRRHGHHILDSEASLPLIAETFASRPWKRAIAPGFISRDSDGRFTNLGRGGSDYTAAILAAALNASVLEIWTDVDGFMTADPRIIPDAQVIDHLSFIEAMELCNFGAKVIYPPTIYPVFNKNIPIYIKNTLRPAVPGTCISDTPHAADPTAPEANFATDKPRREISGVTSMKDTCLISVDAPKGASDLRNLHSRIVNLLSRNGVSFYSLRQSDAEHRFIFGVRSGDADRAVEAVENEFQTEFQTGSLSDISVRRDLATIAMVGDALGHRGPGITDEVADVISAAGCQVVARAAAPSPTTVSVIVPLDSERTALRALHDHYLKFSPV